ncbi:DUF3097 domain-containing protein [Helcobacillus massiliensis]|uniref:DUF3097 family protein n=1 Tax=Helcobacillus massiliensis TaxID=521392 RepID=A0A839QPV9_9MICO|nr:MULTISPECIES: DUF3097 domain-containing protein [Helcobacillus]MBB3022533.1 hypothetical protein [Helcobacillus massiliensis]MCG7426585.1 DUF3097 domain-containing protein [Helcobacillus sp. ACRRO]MCT1557167.1 DUF3097 domain-containing protein [Helcobacillus massiliensis]MCT2036098.1 DUF3097 domain-containing protein [Helcobacillus massiliensis]MCT2331229.1 DUF3097 domain-containing protein [Helcobacillus massiliensis]
MTFDRYGSDILAGTAQPHRPRRPASAPVPAERGLVVEDASTGWVGAITRVEKTAGAHVVELEDRHGRLRSFTLGPGFLIDGRPVTLTPPQRRAQTPSAPGGSGQRLRSASGSVYVKGAKARVARGSRIWVEGRHDAELVQKVWGHDLRIEGVVVEMLDGADNLAERVRAFGPGPGQKLGILVDHLVAGSKETRIAEEVMRLPGAREHVLILGHPYVDVWQAVKPERVGLREWPHVPKGTDIKQGSLAALGWPHATKEDVGLGWQRILQQVRSYADVEPTLSGRIEELIDWVTAEGD